MQGLRVFEADMSDSDRTPDLVPGNANISPPPSEIGPGSRGRGRAFPGFVIAEAPSGKFRLRISTEALENLGAAVATTGEATGILLGRVRETDVLETTIDDFTPYLASNRRLPSESLAVV